MSKNMVRCAILGLACILVACVGRGFAAQKTTLKLSHDYAIDGVVDRAMKHFASEVDRLSDGQMTVEIYPGGVLGTWRECLEAMEFGTVDMVAESLGTLEPYCKLAGLEGAPYLYKDEAHFYRVWDGPVGAEVIEEIVRQTNRRFLNVMWRGARQLATVKPVENLADLKGLKVRVPPEETYIRTWKALGANPTPMSLSEVFTALQQRVIEGVEQPINVMLEESWMDVCKNLIMTYHAAEPFGIIMWEPTFKRLSKDSQAILSDAAHLTTEWMRMTIANEEKEALDAIKAMGVKVVYPDLEPFREAGSKTVLTPEVQKWADKVREVE
ncbi:MAG TPA: TRAP transporter substrate-binding protein [Bacillota bacterium]|nr:TRAP transporter substrate-binding protein [Bacillota bacterium]